MLPLIAEVDRTDEFRRALAEFTAWFEQSPGALDARAWCSDGAIPNLDDPRFGRTLYLHAAALMTGLGETVTATSVLDQVLDHEMRIWLRRGGFDSAARTRDAAQRFKADVQALVAAITLRDGLADSAGLEALIGQVANHASPNLDQQVIQLYPGRADRPGELVAPLLPDLLGEALVTRALRAKQHGHRWLDRATQGADAANWKTIFTVLGRAEEHDPALLSKAEALLLSEELAQRAEPALEAVLALAARTAHAGLGAVLAAALRTEGTEEIARRLSPHLPWNSVMLREVAAWASETLVKPKPASLWRRFWGWISPTPLERRAERAERLVELSKRLGDLGQHDEALAAIREARDIYRRLAQHRPDAFLPHLATSLNNLSVRLGEQGQHDEALAAIREAVDIRRRLAQHRPDAFLPDLALSLNNLSNRLSDLGRPEEALPPTREALEIIWPFFIRRPAAHAGRVEWVLGRCQELAGEEPWPELDERQRQFDEWRRGQ